MKNGESSQPFDAGRERRAAAPSPRGPDRHLRALAEILVKSQSVHRPTLARQLGLSRQTVSELMANLEQRDLVQVDGSIDGLPGRSALSYALRPAAALAMGFDGGGTKLVGALADLRGTVLAEIAEPPERGGLAQSLAQLGRMADVLVVRSGLPRFRVQSCAVGVRAPEREGLADLLEAEFGCPVVVENDVALALLGEVTAGRGRGLGDVAFVALGTGVGAGLMVNGRLLRGANGGAGEIALLPLPEGQFERAVGEAGIRASFKARGGREDASAHEILDLAAAGDQAASETLDELARRLAFGIAALVALVDPGLVVMGGSIGARPALIDRTAAELARRFGRPMPLARSEVGARAGLVGALEMARSRLMTNLFGEPEATDGW